MFTMRLILTIAVVLLAIATILAATTSVLLGLGPLAWLIFGVFAYVVDVWIGERAVLNTSAVPRVQR